MMLDAGSDDPSARPPPTPEGHRWFLAQVKPNCLAIARTNLGRQGIPSFAPLIRETRRTGTRFIQRAGPLFPGYVFVSIAVDRGLWQRVNSTHGLTRIVAFGGRPAAVPHGLVDEIALRCDGEGVLLPPPSLAPGDAVRIADGPFAGLLAEVERAGPDRRVIVLLDLMGQQTRMQVPREALVRR